MIAQQPLPMMGLLSRSWFDNLADMIKASLMEVSQSHADAKPTVRLIYFPLIPQFANLLENIRPLFVMDFVAS